MLDEFTGAECPGSPRMRAGIAAKAARADRARLRGPRAARLAARRAAAAARRSVSAVRRAATAPASSCGITASSAGCCAAGRSASPRPIWTATSNVTDLAGFFRFVLREPGGSRGDAGPVAGRAAARPAHAPRATQFAGRQPAQHRRPLRPRQRLLPRLARRRHALFERALSRRRRVARGRAGEQGRTHPRAPASCEGGEHILEIGCGWGAFARRAAAAGARVTGPDALARAARIVGANGRARPGWTTAATFACRTTAKPRGASTGSSRSR